MPKSYIYEGNDSYFNGDVNKYHGRITLAWPAVKKGFEIPDDSLNLCIHEFAHTLVLQDRYSFFFRFFEKVAWDEYSIEANKKLEKIRAGKNKVLRDYGGTNLMELFSVCLETFFEEPAELSLHEPQLYNKICLLLKQDPRKKEHPLL